MEGDSVIFDDTLEASNRRFIAIERKNGTNFQVSLDDVTDINVTIDIPALANKGIAKLSGGFKSLSEAPVTNSLTDTRLAVFDNDFGAGLQNPDDASPRTLLCCLSQMRMRLPRASPTKTVHPPFHKVFLQRALISQ